MNIFLNTSIFLLCSYLGYIKAYDYTCRVNNLKSFIFTLKYLEDEIIYKRNSLPEALKATAEGKSTDAAKLFLDSVCADFSHNSSELYKNWCTKIDCVLSNSSLTTEDKEIILELGKGIGSTDIMGQSQLFSRIHKLLEEQLGEAQKLAATKGKMYKSLGIAVGLALVILFL